MMRHLFLIGAFMLLNTIISFSQSVWHITYNFHTEEDTTSYSGLLFRNEDGSGFIQLHYKDPVTNENRLQKLDITENYFADDNGDEASTLIVKTIINTPDNDGQISLTLPVLLFKPHKLSDNYEPAAVCTSEDKPVMDKKTSFTSRFFKEGELTKSFAATYFKKDDDFFKNYFRPKSRGSFTLFPWERNIRMHLIIAADVKDSSIGYSCEKDMKKTVETFTSIRKYIGITDKNFIVQQFYGSSYAIKNVRNAITNLKPGPNDIVVFYYSGHGFRVNEIDTFPYIKLKTFHTTVEDIMANSLRIKEDIFQVIKSKGARFNLVVSDCCNSSIEESAKEKGPKEPKQRGDDQWSFTEDNIRALFLNKTPSSILVTGAKNGEKARCHPNYNGFFSNSFFSSLKQFSEKGKNKVDWLQLLETAKAGTNKIAQRACCSIPCCERTCPTRVPCTQTAVYSMQYGRR